MCEHCSSAGALGGKLGFTRESHFPGHMTGGWMVSGLASALWEQRAPMSLLHHLPKGLQGTLTCCPPPGPWPPLPEACLSPVSLHDSLP